MTGQDRLVVGELAAYTGLTAGTIKNYSATGRLPKPDELRNEHLSRPTKVWFKSTIDSWQATRRRR